MRRDRDRLEDIAEAIEKIGRRSDVSYDVFRQDELVQTWMVHHI